MRGTNLASLVAAVAISLPAMGCTQCASPYDYCGPTFTGGPGEMCDARARAGSIFWPPHGQIAHAGHYEFDGHVEYYGDGEYEWYDDEVERYERPVEYEEPIHSTQRPTTRMRR